MKRKRTVKTRSTRGVVSKAAARRAVQAAIERLKPHRHTGAPNWWWYEGTGGILIYHDVKDGGSERLFIPWTSIRAALKRKDKKKKKKKKESGG